MINKAFLLGYVGRIETITTNNGLKVTNLSLATNEQWIKEGQKEQKTTWHNVCLFLKLSDIVERLVNKGDLISIEGKIENKKYTDKAGIEKYSSYVIATGFKLIKSKEQEFQKQAEESPGNDNFLDDDIPPW